MTAQQLVQIPVIDFSSFLEADRLAQQQTAQQVYHACHHIGFLYAKNFGLSPELVQQMFQQAAAFFNQSEAVKQQVAWADPLSNRGYIGITRERLDPRQPGDLKEAFNLGRESTPTELALATDPATPPMVRMMHYPNLWPAKPETFRPVALEFFEACTAAMRLILRAFGTAMQLSDEDYFADRHQKHCNTLRLLHYPPVLGEVQPGQVRAGAHSDYGSVTLLFQDEVGGLEVRTADGEWIAAPPIPGTIVVNTGDLMQRWTNHEFTSTLHRVRVPADDRAQTSRYAIAFFGTPDFDAEIGCVSSSRLGGRSPMYPPILAGEYLLSRLNATY